MMKKILSIIGLVLLISAALWHFWFSQRWTNRITPGWRWEANFIGTSTFADPETGEFPSEDQIQTYERVIEPVSWNPSGSVVLEDRYTTRDVITNQKTWEYIFRAEVDAKSGAHLQDEFRGDYFVFPRHVEKKEYKLRYSSFKGLPFSFQEEKEIEGLQTYLFAYKGAAEYTESYAGTADFEGITVELGQEIRCADDQLTTQLWVEPVTGEMIKVAESCPSGDYVYDVASDQQLYPLARWEGVSAGDDVILRADWVRAERTKYLWIARYIPLLLSLGGLFALGYGFAARRS